MITKLDKIQLKQSAAGRLTGWVHWQRDPKRSPNCWTKVFAVLDKAFLWFFQREESAPRSLLVQVAVADVVEDDGRILNVMDSDGERLCICLYDNAAFECWYSRLAAAAELTAAFFARSGVEVRDLPSRSNYRGTLRKDSRTTKCRGVFAQMTRQWRTHVSKHDDDLEETRLAAVKTTK
ncbi:unnamed protein product [Phytophthora fragariaefolia]|uniref:Unnamed protein product n=1 Tax=Phytophthora fragariaefolia TaxID=1490495 RepID=A0A9W6WUZ0_9STRA|nr:unnamed protein product [Phytophthora fragariaefolia]